MSVLSVLLLGFAFPAVVWAAAKAGRWSGWLASLLPFSLFAFFARMVPEIVRGEVVLESHPWAPLLGLSLSFRVDGLSLLFALLISGIGGLVTVYAGSYLEGHPQLGRFFVLLLLFMCSMLGVVLADNLLALFVFWELTSLSSYLLIGFDHANPLSRAAALQGLLVTVGGGQALLAGLLLLGLAGGSFDTSRLLENADAIRAHALYAPILLLILGGAFTKSAQVPFHFWLPGAMQAPTPVSAYLHSATMVKAGVYLLARLTPVLGGTSLWWTTVSIAGGVTMLVGGFLSLGETDAKRVLAYATVCVLGTLTLLIGLGTPVALQAALVFLLAHALYKGALFLVAGAIDHGTGTREVPQLGGLRRAMPVTASVAAMAAVAMAGLLPAFGFIGKEAVYEAALGAPRAMGLVTLTAVLAFIPLVAAAANVGVGPFFGALRETPRQPHEVPPAMWLGPLVLAALGIALGLYPAVLEEFLTRTSVALHPGAPDVSLKLWHGVTPALGLSVASLVLGLAVYRFRAPLRRGINALPLSRLGPSRLYELGLTGLNAVARAQTRLIQTGYLRHYLTVTLLATGGVVGFQLFVRSKLLPRLDLRDVRFHEGGIAVLMLVAAVAAARSRSRLGSVAAMGVVGFGVALLFLFFGAPDLALTQAIVEALTVVVFLLALFHLPRYRELSHRAARTRDLVVSLGFGALMTTLVLLATQRHLFPSISAYFLEASVPEAHGRNVVNVILVDFRALDTLGEITVLGIASVGVYALLRLRPRAKEAR